MEEHGSNHPLSPLQASQKETSRSPKCNFKVVHNEVEPAAVSEPSANINHRQIDTSNTDKQSLCSRASEVHAQDTQYVTVHISNNEQDPLTMPLEERQKLARAKRNREAAYRSRAKNKIRQCAVEEDTRKSLALNTQLRHMLEFLLARLRSPSAADSASQQNKRT